MMLMSKECQAPRGCRILLLSGFLGAGKTTLLKQLLASAEDLSDTAVIVNEFGEVGIDGALLADAGSNMVELTNGCICCTLSGDLNRTLTDLWATARPGRVLIEASGVADPAIVAKALDDPELARWMSLHTVITVLDALHWQSRHVFGSVFFHQLRRADLILLNKIDLLPEDQVEACLGAVQDAFPNARIVPAVRCAVDPDTLWAAGAACPTGGMGKPAQPSPGDREGHGFISFSFRATRPLDEDHFTRFVDHMPSGLFRMKGPVCFRDRTVMVNHVGGRTDYADWDRGGHTTLAFIGWDISQEQILRDLGQCVVRPRHEHEG